MVQPTAAQLGNAIANWETLKRWDRRELGQTLRMTGLSYGEIGRLIPVSRSTLSYWCRDIVLSEDQLSRIRSVGGNSAVGRAKAGAKLRARNQSRVEAIRDAGRREAEQLSEDPRWIAGVIAYWAEGAKRQNRLSFSNSDPRLIRLFVDWALGYLEVERARLTIKLLFIAVMTKPRSRPFGHLKPALSCRNFANRS